MLSLSEAIHNCMREKASCVHSNVGRRPDLIANFFATYYPTIDIHVISPFYDFPEIKNLYVNTPQHSSCDVLIYFEPPIDHNIQTYSGEASRVIIFTSHNLLKLDNADSIYNINAYIEVNSNFADDCNKTTELVQKQQKNVSQKNVNIVKKDIDFFNVKTLSRHTSADYLILPGKPYPQFKEETFVIVDLTHCVSPSEAFLHLLDAFEVLKINSHSVKRWVICFGEHSEEKFRNVEQRYIDQATCLGKYENYNVLMTTPFFRKDAKNIKSIEEKLEQIPSFDFCAYKVYVPTNEFDATLLNGHVDVKDISRRIYLEKKQFVK